MRVRVALSSGFCKGVRRAFALAEKALEGGGPVYFLGELIHNHDAMKALLGRGARIVQSVLEIPEGAIVVTRSHGIPKDLREELLKKGTEIVDTTCPKVRRLQVLAQQLEEEGYTIIILGEQSHPEVQALLSYLAGEARVVSRESEWQEMLQQNSQVPVAVLAQTTFPGELLQRLEDWVRKEGLSRVLVVHTLCNETETRQKELEDVLQEEGEGVAVVVVGGKHSANTRSLFEIARRKGVSAFWVENVAELGSLSFPAEASVFVVSGTSTPGYIVAEVAAYLESQGG